MDRYRLLAFALILTLPFSSEAVAITVPDGCATPNVPATRNSFYVDPARGSMNNDGSAERPWSTLAEVLDAKRKLIATQAYSGSYQKGNLSLLDQSPSAPIRPGDIIYAYSGDHGNVQITGAVNKEFITVQAPAGQIPKLRSLRVNSASKWMFVGLKIQGAGDGSSDSLPGAALVEFGRNQFFGPADNIVLAGSSISTADDSDRWSDIDWVKKPFMAGLSSFATCVTISGNHLFNLRNALGIEGDQSLVSDNRIERFGNDAIDIVASRLVIRNNSITDGRHTKSEPLHADGIQGWTKNGQTNVDVMIEGNVVIKTGDGEKDGGYLQGITAFDGKWERLRIINNVVITNTWHGITISGVTDAEIINNTVIAYDPIKFLTWISVKKAKDGSPPKKVIVRNNIAPRLDYNEDGVTVDHNIIAKMIATSSNGKPVFISKPGNYGDQNVVDPNVYETLTSVDHSRAVYDLRPKPNSPAVGRGNIEHAPKTDIVGKKRTRSVDIGAYAR